jgi:hypothetical protein
MLLSLCSLLLGACAPPTPDPAIYYTQAAQTIAAEATQAAIGTAFALLTQLASSPTPRPPRITLPPPLPTFTPSPTLEATATPTPSLTPFPCDEARFVRDVTIPDGVELPPNVAFVKTWRIQNAGECNWTSGYVLAFVEGDALNAPQVIGLSSQVQPGETIDVSLPMTAPAQAGDYQGRWELRSPNGSIIPIINTEQGSLWTRITIVSPPANTLLYDFSTSVCQARWRSRVGELLCPGSTNDPAGSVALLNRPNLETRRVNDTAIWLRPDTSSDGWISGDYPFFNIADGDRFLAEIGCLADSPRCRLSFRLDYRTVAGLVWNLGVWDENSDGRSTAINIDLSPLAGETVQFIFYVGNLGRAADANAFWLAPRLQGRSPGNVAGSERLLTWRLEGGRNNDCQELNIYLTGRASGEARAVDCRRNPRDLGSLNLSSTDLNRLLDLYDRLTHTDIETFTPASGEPIITIIEFNGRGRQEASANDIDVLERLAERLYGLLED